MKNSCRIFSFLFEQLDSFHKLLFSRCQFKKFKLIECSLNNAYQACYTYGEDLFDFRVGLILGLRLNKGKNMLIAIKLRI